MPPSLPPKSTSFGRNPNMFAGNPLDRASQPRRNADWLALQMIEPNTRIVPFWNLHPMILETPGEQPDQIGWLRPGLDDPTAESALCVFLGLQDNIAHFALDVSHLKDPEHVGPLAGLGQFHDLRNVAHKLAPDDAAILAQAKAMIDWHSRHMFCAACGAETTMREGGYLRHCDACGADHFPRTDPVVIGVVAMDDVCLLGRGPGWPDNFYSCIAGFMEPGETFEDAFRREVLEETGVKVSRVRYHSTQPWPYPASIMIGCICEASSKAITLDDKELLDARWVARDQVRAILKGERDDTLWLPPPVAIAHQLLKTWVNEG